MCLLQKFSPSSVVYLFILLTVSFTEKNFKILMMVLLSIFFFHRLCLWCHVYKVIAKPTFI